MPRFEEYRVEVLQVVGTGSIVRTSYTKDVAISDVLLCLVPCGKAPTDGGEKAENKGSDGEHATRFYPLKPINLTRIRDKVSMQTVLTALLFRHKQVRASGLLSKKQ